MFALQHPDILIVAAGLLCGILIGLVAVGGVLLVPILHVFGGIPLRDAVTISMAGFLFTGILSLATVSREVFHQNALYILVASCLLGAGIGAFVLDFFPSGYLTWAVAAVIFLGAFDRLRRRPVGLHKAERVSIMFGGFSGLFAGFGSAISGTGGPLILMPLFSWQGLPLRQSISLAQALQLPIAGAATAFNAYAGAILPRETLLASIALVAGMATGGFVGRRIPLPWLAHAVTVAMFIAGIVLISQRLFPVNNV